MRRDRVKYDNVSDIDSVILIEESTFNCSYYCSAMLIKSKKFSITGHLFVFLWSYLPRKIQIWKYLTNWTVVWEILTTCAT